MEGVSDAHLGSKRRQTPGGCGTSNSQSQGLTEDSDCVATPSLGTCESGWRPKRPRGPARSSRSHRMRPTDCPANTITIIMCTKRPLDGLPQGTPTDTKTNGSVL